MKKKKRFDIAFLLGGTFLVTLIQLYIIPLRGAYVPTFLYFVVPTIYLIWNYRLNIKKIVAGSLLIGILIPLSFDLLVQLNGSWFVPYDKLLIPFKLFGFYPVDEIIWFFFLAAYTLVFYEVFVDDEKIRKLSKNFKKGVAVWVVAILLTFVAILFFRNSLFVPYSYLVVFAPFSIPPIIYVIWRKPRLIRKFTLPTAFFFFVALNFEIVGLTFGDWVFNSQYVGWFSAFGRFFPFEELFYWMLLYPATALSYYELFVDDGK